MDGKHFLLSSRLLLRSGSHEADFRSAISRAYYACYLVTRKLAFNYCDKRALKKAGIKDEINIRHDDLIAQLKNSSNKSIRNLGVDLASLRGIRSEADYEMSTSISSTEAVDAVYEADNFLMSLSQIDSSQIGLAVEEQINRTYSNP